MKSGKCLVCGSLVPVQDGDSMGALIFCPVCDTELEIVKVDPVQFDWPLIELSFEEELIYEDFQDVDFVFDEEDLSK